VTRKLAEKGVNKHDTKTRKKGRFGHFIGMLTV
jgi:hypothetical protein